MARNAARPRRDALRVTIDDRLAAALRAGELLDLLPHTPAGALRDEWEMRGWDTTHDIDAGQLRQLLLNSQDGDADPRGLQLRGARILGQLDLDYLTARIGLLLEDCLLDDGVTAEQAHLPGLWLHRCRVSHPDRSALNADRLRVDGPMGLDGSVITAATMQGAVRLFGARIDGQLNLRATTVRNSHGPAVVADGMQTGSDALLDEGFAAEGAGEHGAVGLSGARIGGWLSLQAAVVRNSDGPALFADGLQTGKDALLDEGFTAEGAGDEAAALRLRNARIGGWLNLRSATARNHDGSALDADGLHADGDAFLRRFTAEAAGEYGAVRLSGARIGGRLDLDAAVVRNSCGPALVADGLQTDGDVFLGDGLIAEGAGELGVIRLSRARVGGQLTLIGATVDNPSDQLNRWRIDGLTYTGVPRLAWERNREFWLQLLRTGTPTYAAQPYQQLAAAYRAEGHDSDVRAILIAQREDQIGRGGLSRADRWWARTTGLLLGYGYQPWRALLYLAGVLALSVALALLLGGQGALARTTSPMMAPAAAPGSITIPATTPCTLVQTIGRGLDLGAPFLPITPAVAGSCQPTASAHGEALTISRWVLQLAAWALAALFIAGFTGIVRKT